MKNKELIKIGFCVAYDWPMLKHALPLVYEWADNICLSIDKDRISWSGQHFDFDHKEFTSFIGSLDAHKRITIFEEDFHKPDLSPMQNEVRQRNRMAEQLGAGGWHIQLDADEYFINFATFIEYLQSLPKYSYHFNVCCPLITLFKSTKDGFLVIDPKNVENVEHIQIATRFPRYQYGRRNGYFNRYTNFQIVHQSWARSEEDIQQKINSWGHINDFKTKQYFQFWKSLSDTNFSSINNFHPTHPSKWPCLQFVKANNITEFIQQINKINFPSLSPIGLLLRNSRIYSKLRELLMS